MEKNARRIKCEVDAKIIQRYCRKILDKVNNKLIEKWKNLARKIMPHVINQTAKFNHMNKILNKLLKKKFLDNLIDSTNRKNLLDMLKYLVEKNDKDSSKNLLRKKFREWLDKTKKLRDIEDDAAAYIQSMYRGYQTRKQNKINQRITYLLTKIIAKIITTSEDSLQTS